MKRPCVFLVADGTIAQVLRRFLSRGYLEDRLGCWTFGFDFQQDVVVDVRNGNTDVGIHRRDHALLRPYLPSHQNAVILLDKNFGGRLSAAVVRGEILSNLLRNGWSAECVEVVVIDPELETWLWQRGNPHVARAFRYKGPVSLEAFLEAEGFWSTTALKPARPKEAVRLLLQRYRGGPPIVVYARLVAALRRWFPLDP